MNDTIVHDLHMPITDAFKFLDTLEENISSIEMHIQKEMEMVSFKVTHHIDQTKWLDVKVIKDMVVTLKEELDASLVREEIEVTNKVIGFFDNLNMKLKTLETLVEPELKRYTKNLADKIEKEALSNDNGSSESNNMIMRNLLKRLQEVESNKSSEEEVLHNEDVAKMKEVLESIADIDDNTFMNNLMTKVLAYNQQVQGLEAYKAELDEYLKLLPNKDKYHISTNDSGIVDIIEIPSIVPINVVNTIPGLSNFLYKYDSVDGYYSEIEFKSLSAKELWGVLITKERVPFKHFTTIKSGNCIFAVEHIVNLGLDGIM